MTQFNTFKKMNLRVLSHGYICNDQNMPGVKEACRDMKLRFCCVKALRAQWSVWGEWSSCSQSCDGGRRERRRSCQQTERRREGLAQGAEVRNISEQF